jgi:hypothetical protein
MSNKKNNNKGTSPIIGTVGMNYKVQDTPCLIPKENIQMFHELQRQSQHSSFGNFPNPYDAFWPKPKKS